MNIATTFKYTQELNGYLRQDINQLPMRERFATAKRIDELIELLGGDPVSTKNELEPIVVARDEDGTEHRVMGLNGNPDLGVMPDGIPGVKPLPIRLQENSLSSGHLQRHLNDLQKAGYANVEEAVVDIARNFEQVYSGPKEGQVALVKPIDIEENGEKRRGVLLVEFQEKAGIYRVGTVFATTRENYLRKRKLLWDRSLSIAYTDESARTRGLTGPEQFSYAHSNEDQAQDQERQSTSGFYTVREKGTSRQKLNDRAINLIEEFNNDPNKKPTDAEKQVLAQFSGFGGGLIDKTTGQKGSAYEYYTPKPIAEGVWDCLQGLGFSGGKILDPSAGTGIFGATAPLNAAVDSVELSPLSGRVNQLVNNGPGYNTTISNFEKVAAKTRDNVYDAVVTNVPFGAVADRGANRMDDSRYQDDPLEVYFILRSLEKLKPNGLAAFIVPMRCVSGKGGKPEELRTKATMMAEFVGAYRLPSGTFSTASTDTATDVIFFRKFSDETAEKIAELSEQKPELLSEAKIQWETFIEGKYFDSSEGKKYVLGEFVAKDPTKFRDVDKVISNAGLNDLREILRTRKLPKSRINWELLETSETTPIVYNEGDTINQAGCTLVMRNGVWVQLPKESVDREIADLAGKLSDPYKAFENKVTYSSAERYKSYIDQGQSWADMPDWFRETFATLAKLPQNDRSTYWNKGLVALSVSQVLKEHSGETGFDYHGMYSELSKALEKVKIAKKDKMIGGNLGAAMGVAVQQYFRKKFSDFWLGNVAEETRKSEEVEENIDTPEARLNRLVYATKSAWLDIELVKEIRGTDFDPISDSDWCVSPDGKKVISANDYYVGNYGEFLAKIDTEIAQAGDEKIKAKLLRQKIDAESRAGKINVSRFTFDLRVLDSIVTPEEKVSFLKSFVSPYAQISHDDFGRPYADIVIKDSVKNTWREKLYNRVGDYIKKGTISVGTMKFDKEDKIQNEIVKEEALKELKTIINRANENFNAWARGNKVIMSRLQAMADDPKNRRFISVEDETEIRIPGMNPSLHLHGYQSAYVRQMGREFGGINGFGVGLGKTFTSLAAVQHVQAMGVKDKTIFVVPNSVLANWRKEASNAYSSTEDCLFVGLRTDKNGKSKTNSSLYAEDLSLIKENKHSKIFMTFEAFKRIRVKDETIEEFGRFMRTNDDSYAFSEKKKTDEKRKGKLADLLSKFNDSKQSAFPYIEDLGVDSIVIDEAHAFKNGATAVEFKGGKYLSLTEASARGLDAQLKTWYIRGQSPLKDGVLMLTATPITNSPLEIFSMLSLAVGLERVNNSMIGCRGADDFLDETCVISQEVGVQVDGMQKSMNIFTGLKNVDVLRQAIGQVVTVKEAKDVGAKVFIPGRDVKSNKITLDNQSIKILQDYKLAYRYATEKTKQELEKKFNEEFLREPYKGAFERISTKFHEPTKIIGHPFNLIQKMSRAILDKELDEKATFYMIPESENAFILAEDVCNKFNELGIKEDRDRMSPWTKDEAVLSKKNTKDKETGEEKTVLTIHVESDVQEGGAVLINDQEVGDVNTRSRVAVDSIEPKAQNAYENLAEKNQLLLDVTCSPKMAALIENFKNEMAHPRGMISEDEKSPIVKQIIFCDELALHNKIKRLLSSKCGIPAGKIAIITGQTNNEPEQLQDVSDGFNAQGEDNRFQVIIANEKAEVGINLQKGTQAIHHLTIGWTPDSLEQRNGRGARQGNKTERVTIYYYDAEGTFDEARREMVNKKSDWIGKVLDVNGDANVDIKGGLSTAEQEALIEATGDAEGTRKIREALEAKEKQARTLRYQEAQINNIDMVVKQKAFLKKYEEAKTFLIEKVCEAFNIKLSLDKLTDNYDKEKTQAEKNGKPISEAIRNKRETAIASAKESFEKACRALDESATFMNTHNEPETPFASFEGLLEFAADKAWKKLTAEKLAENLAYGWSYSVKPKETGALVEAWKVSREQAESLIEQATQAYSEQSKAEGAFSAEILERFNKGEGRISGSTVVTIGSFVLKNDELFVVYSFNDDTGRMYCKGISNENKSIEAYLNISDTAKLNLVLPGSPRYVECLRQAAELEDRTVDAGLVMANYSEYINEVSQYRTKADLVKYKRRDYLLASPYFGEVIDLTRIKNSPFLKAIAESQKDVVRSSDYSYFVVSADTEVIKESWNDRQRFDAYRDFAKAHGLRPTFRELSDADVIYPYESSTSDYFDLSELKEALKTPVEGQTVVHQAEEWIKSQLDWIDCSSWQLTNYFRSVGSIVEEADRARTQPEDTLDSYKVDPEITVAILGETYRWKERIKHYASEVGDTARWRKYPYPSAWVVKGKTWNKMIDEKGREVIEDLKAEER
ncbi:SNF2-related protein [uncultured Parasutterella sp.]|uniref:SNF2-related protein n=12 Tax=uncultured Parasutterella sp. TaxID=1263098 RepID=UPI00261E4B0F|nr:SNF2-related protein [uncultured Parasutterella sp.]